MVCVMVCVFGFGQRLWFRTVFDFGTWRTRLKRLTYKNHLSSWLIRISSSEFAHPPQKLPYNIIISRRKKPIAVSVSTKRKTVSIGSNTAFPFLPRRARTSCSSSLFRALKSTAPSAVVDPSSRPHQPSSPSAVVDPSPRPHRPPSIQA